MDGVGFTEGHGDNDAVARAYPQALAGDEQRCDAHEGEAQLARAWEGGGMSSID